MGGDLTESKETEGYLLSVDLQTSDCAPPSISMLFPNGCIQWQVSGLRHPQSKFEKTLRETEIGISLESCISRGENGDRVRDQTQADGTLADNPI